MITIILFCVVLGISLVCGLIVFADSVEPWLMRLYGAARQRAARIRRRIIRELMARWLTEYGLTVVPENRPEIEDRLAECGDMMEIINRL